MTAYRRLIGPVIALTLLIVPLAGYLLADEARLARLGFRLHAPDWRLMQEAGLVIQLHVVGALTALAIGTVLLVGVKGTRRHRILGWSWVAAMAVTATSSLFIHRINPGGLSVIHLLSGWTIISLPMAIYAIRRGKVQAHRRAMTGMFVGGLIVAGAFTFLPGRLMWAIFFG
nr:DUF2306 domain-containing protein [uncultured Brevundimonas sp.]